MRPYLAIGLFALAIVVAACGGGGSGAAPTIPASAAPAQTPLRYASAKLSLRIPAQAVASSMKRPAYVSPNTQSVQIFAYPVASPSASPSPQTFAVAVPPCTQNSDGSKTCTFQVQAPYGQDQFVVKTFAVASPTASSVPLAVFTSGTVNVTSGGTPPQLNFALTGVVASVSVAMQSPDPSITPSTQIGTIGSPTTSSMLLLMPKDASGAAIMTDTFAQPIMVNVTPAAAGVSLMLTSNSQCTPASSASGTSASITCASDLNKLAFRYDGTTSYNSGSVIDHIAFEGWPQPNGSPAPAFLALQGTAVNYSLPYGPLTSLDPFVRFVKNPGTSQTYTYLLEGGSDSVLGQVDLTNPSAAPPVRDLGYYAPSMTVDHAGNIWVAQTYSSTLQCFSSITDNNPASVNTVVTPMPSADPVQPDFVTTDTQGNVWFYGPDYFSIATELGFVPNPTSCTSAPSTVGSIANTGSDSPVDLETAPTGGVVVLGQYNIYNATTTSSGSLAPTVLPSGEGGQGVTVDAMGDAYVGLAGEGPPSEVALLPHNQSTFTSTLATLYSTGAAYGVGVNQTTMPSTLIYALTDYSHVNALAVGSATSFSNFAFLPENGPCYAAFVDSNGDAWGLCWTTDPVTQNNVAQLTHIVRTSVWNALVPSAPLTGQTTLIPILEAGDKGPFTVTASDPAAISTPAPTAGYENTIPVTFTGSGSSQVTITVTDAFGRSESTSVAPQTALARRRSAKLSAKKLPSRTPPRRNVP